MSQTTKFLTLTLNDLLNDLNNNLNNGHSTIQVNKCKIFTKNYADIRIF